MEHTSITWDCNALSVTEIFSWFNKQTQNFCLWQRFTLASFLLHYMQTPWIMFSKMCDRHTPKFGHSLTFLMKNIKKKINDFKAIAVFLLFCFLYCSINYLIFQIANFSFTTVLQFQTNLTSKNTVLLVFRKPLWSS